MAGRQLQPMATRALFPRLRGKPVDHHIVALAIAFVIAAANYAAMSAECNAVSAFVATVPTFISQIGMVAAVSTMASIATKVDNIHNVTWAVFDNVSVHCISSLS